MHPIFGTWHIRPTDDDQDQGRKEAIRSRRERSPVSPVARGHVGESDLAEPEFITKNAASTP